MADARCYLNCHDLCLRKLDWLFNGHEELVPDVVYLGDSVLERVSDSDHNRLGLAGQVATLLLPRLRTATFSHTAFNPAVFKRIIGVIAASQHRPRHLLIPINLRSFSPQWYAYPEYQFLSFKALFDRYLLSLDAEERRRLLNQVPEADKKSEGFRRSMERYLALRSNFHGTNLRAMGDFLQFKLQKPVDPEAIRERRRLMFIFHYLYEFSGGHPLLTSLGGMLRLIATMDVNVVFYLTPVNYQAGIEYVGPEFTVVLNEHKKVIINFMNSMFVGRNCVLHDFSTLLGSDAFFQPHIANEHLNEHGRAVLAAAISDAMQQQWGERFASRRQPTLS